MRRIMRTFEEFRRVRFDMHNTAYLANVRTAVSGPMVLDIM